MIRFSAALVVVAIGVLIGGVATSSLLLVYLAIGVSALALVVLAVGVALKRDELFVDAARPASSSAQERPEQSAGLHEFGQQRAPESQAVSGWPEAANWQGAQSGPAQDSVAAGAGAPWSAFGRGDSSQASSMRLGAWPPAEPGFPAAAAAASGTSAPSKPSGLRRAEPPTRADPVLPWADALPTRVDIVKGGGPAEPAPNWLADEDDKPAGPPAGGTPAAPQSPDVDDAAGHGWPATDLEAGPTLAAGTVLEEDTVLEADTTESEAITEPEANAEPEADTIAASSAAEADEDTTHAMWSTISWGADADDTDVRTEHISAGTEDSASAEDSASTEGTDDIDASAGDTEASPDATVAGIDEVGPSAGEADEVLEAGQPAEEAEPREPNDSAESSEPAEGKPSSSVGQVTVVPGVPRYHEADCILIRFMDDESLQRMTVAEAEEAGCTPCRACQPE